MVPLSNYTGIIEDCELILRLFVRQVSEGISRDNWISKP